MAGNGGFDKGLWKDNDLYRIFLQLSQLNNLDLLVNNAPNIRTKTFTIETIDSFEIALNAWYQDAGSANYIILEHEYIQDNTGQTSLIIHYK